MNNVPPAPTNFPPLRTNPYHLRAFQSPVLDEIAHQAAAAYMAGMLVIPTDIVLTERAVSVRPQGSLLESITTRYIMSAIMPKPLGHEAILVTIASEDPRGGTVNETTTISVAKVYMWDETRGWTHTLDFEHRWMRKREGYGFEELFGGVESDDGVKFPDPR
jgi:hypothetical protein